MLSLYRTISEEEESIVTLSALGVIPKLRIRIMFSVNVIGLRESGLGHLSPLESMKITQVSANGLKMG
jgi:hypothetical protein